MTGWRGAHSLSAEDAGAWARELKDVVLGESKPPKTKGRQGGRAIAAELARAWRNLRGGAPRKG